MTSLEFKLNVLKLHSLRFSTKEKEAFSELVDHLELENKEDFFEDMFYELIQNYNYLNFKDFLECFRKNLNDYIKDLVAKSKIKNFNHKLFLQEEELLSKYFKVKIYKNLPKWFQG
ncbi:hypothetical protein DMB92_05310 [Campylobacter sp. MIT 99-7217]|uniref:hypothetical protein n=1 Tax=Campylobacter sp. MIT 99-7217 TaxID=535091 RepID=UPI00115A33C2|nr:hypothetical protein [Campylobacter sp. MIT 99-7217]TQR31807.1 hypothetical protein DMB92_05310 [Campylobacter sp. MIT 99-7217]